MKYKLTFLLTIVLLIGCSETRTDYKYLDQFRNICDNNGGVNNINILQTGKGTYVSNVVCEDGAEYGHIAIKSKIKVNKPDSTKYK